VRITSNKVDIVERKRKSKMRLITVHLPEPYIKGLEQLVEMGRYPNKSEAIRVAVRDLLANELWSNRVNRINFLSA